MFLFYFTTILLYRVTKQVGNVANLPVLSSTDELSNWINKHSKSVVWFLPEDPSKNNFTSNFNLFEQLNYANYAISKYKSKISFALSLKEFINQSKLIPSNYIEAKAYNNGKDITDSLFQPNPVSFSLWCQDQFLRTDLKKIIYHEELRGIFEGHKNAIIGVDGAPKPNHFPKNEIFYECQSNIFKLFNVNVTKGVYIYRPGDRQLVGPISGNIKNYMKSHIIDIENTYNIDKKRYLAGFFVDGTNDDLTKEEIKLLNKLADKFKNDIQFTSLEHGRICMNIFGSGNYYNMSFPFFFVLDTSFNNQNGTFRWAVSNFKNMHNFDYLYTFVGDILNGEGNKYSHISDEIDDKNPIKVVYKNFNEKVFSNDDKRDKIVLFFRNDMRDASKTLTTLEKVQELLKDFIEVFFYDFSKNDLPDEFAPHAKRLPLIAHFPKGNEKNPSIIYPPFKFDEIVSNISAHSSTHFQVPEYNLDEMRMSILEDLGKKKYYNDEL